jgi:predicted transport protein
VKATEAKLMSFLQKSPQFIIPIYQRAYSWTDKQCRQLWDDKRLRLSINMPFNEINDPKGLCRDITNISRWGNGDVDIGLKSIDELPYVMGLVRQSYERQMGDGG